MDKLEEFRLAIVLFLEARVEMYNRTVKLEETVTFQKRAEADCQDLMKAGKKGLKYGAMGCDKLSLCYDEKDGFFISQEGLNRRDFERFQNYLTKKFRKARLKFTSVASSW